MCYSPEVDLVAGLVVGASGLYALEQVDDRRNLPLAAIPAVLGVHLLIEAVAWWSLEGDLPLGAGELAATAYLIIALGVVPALVPFAVMRSEPNPLRQRRMLPFAVIGVVVAAVLLGGLIANPHHAEVAGRYIAYGTTTPGGGYTVAVYGLAVCVPFLISSHRRLVVFGMANVAAFVLFSALLSRGLISLWCVWAAVTSLIVVRHIRDTTAPPSPTRSDPNYRTART